MIVVAIKKQDRVPNASPTGDTVLDAESTLVVPGTAINSTGWRNSPRGRNMQVPSALRA